MKKILSLSLIALLLLSCRPGKSSTETPFSLPAVDDVVMYQVNPRVFAPEHSLNAVASRVDSIRDLGVNVVWVMPIYPIGKEKTKNSPYSIADYKAVAPEFGTVEDFKNLVDSCHSRGMALILDWVANHTAWDSKWMKEGHKDWYTQDKDGNVIYPPKTDWTDVADLNYDNKEMRKAMLDAMLFWVKEVGVDGFRCDVADWVPADFWKDAIAELRKAAGDRKLLMLAEGNRADNFTVGFDMNYAWDYKNALVKVYKDGKSARLLFETDKAEYDSLPDGKLKMRFTTNHDHSFHATPIGEFGSKEAAMSAYVATIFPHGGALIYGSQEVGYPEPINFFKYVPVDWTAEPQTREEYKMLIGLYNAHPALRKGKMTPIENDDIMAFVKTLDKEEVLVVANVRNKACTLPLPAEWSAAKCSDLVSGKEEALDKEVKLEPYQYRLFLKQ